MKFEFNDKVLNYLQSKNASEVTLDLEDIPVNCCLGRVPELKISLAPPEVPGEYRNFSVRGINIHVSKLLRTNETLTLFLSKPFKNLEVAGVNLVL